MDWLFKFPQATPDILLIKRFIDGSLRAFTRTYGSAIEDLFSPLLRTLIFFENLITSAPWPLVILVLATIAWFAARSWTVVGGVIGTLIAIGLLGLWPDTMKTISLVLTTTIFSIAIGLPLGIVMNRYKRVSGIMQTFLDVMQTMPPFVYLIPVVMLLGIGRVPGFIAVVIYAIPPIIRLTNLGIRLVDKEVLEAADAYGCSTWQKLWKVQMPLAIPTIMAGINQTIMMALAMVVIASMIGVQGLGLNVLQAIANQYFTQGILNGFAIVGIAIIFDRISQAYGKRLQTYRGVGNE
ncbi:MAG: proline/glycine betaine ABC transporter permease [Mesorhizobium sp.]|uniref:ABC transporter permease n=1 Tax=Mesorhizobium sp. TaxID=1871066 RepID=UPI000FEA7987|nr:proline/glycine betaine ABC transporter permease [Mesorhizobium sp.]RWB32143.1 MAG: proline/glycine betaine ABC transporter permease [Mesorhizobium sp.]RWB81198.1 MAG: proline/glycine betaine ABC transporter permease [Mesorhizobium sp.]RWF79288.1 MAG: proline/glycine betaine ABC transporter permease [Mesorhizobium sp.]TIS68456.1 MAG: proline/glycine betaine ABC transporter permease [Mesorhizobium sp.]